MLVMPALSLQDPDRNPNKLNPTSTAVSGHALYSYMDAGTVWRAGVGLKGVKMSGCIGGRGVHCPRMAGGLSYDFDVRPQTTMVGNRLAGSPGPLGCSGCGCDSGEQHPAEIDLH